MKDTIINGKYRILDQLAPGTLITENVSTGSGWVLKEIRKEHSEALSVFGYIRHPSLPRMVDRLTYEGIDYAVFEYIKGKSLYDLCVENGGTIDQITACRIMSDIAGAIHFLHSNEPCPVLHLDIKPSNIVVQDDMRACLIDFGSMFILHNSEIAEDVSIMSTKSFAPYEVISGQRPSSEADIYMIGMTLFRAVTGISGSLMPDSNERSVSDKITPKLLSVIRKCTMYLPEDRYRNALELITELNEVVSVTELTQASERASVNSKGKVICVWGNPLFASELAYCLAVSGTETLLIDADLLAPGADRLIKLSKSGASSDSSLASRCSLGNLMSEFAQGVFGTDSIDRLSDKTGVKKLRCICGDYRTEDYDHYSTDGMAAIIRYSYSLFDAVIIACSKFIYDEFSCVSFIYSNHILIPVTANYLSFREYMKYIDFLSARKQISKEKVMFIGFEHRNDEDLSIGTCQELCCGRFAGTVSFSSRRRMLTGSSKIYTEYMEPKIRRQYNSIIRKINI